MAKALCVRARRCSKLSHRHNCWMVVSWTARVFVVIALAFQFKSLFDIPIFESEESSSFDAPIFKIEESSSVITKIPQGRNWKIIGTTDFPYKDVALQWYQRLEDLGYTEHVIIAHDNETAVYLDALNKEYDNYKEERDNRTKQKFRYRFESYFLPPFPEWLMNMKRAPRLRRVREMLWAARWRYILNQLEAGVSILLTDVDNLFHRYLNLSDYADCWDYDVLHTFGGKYPVHVFEKLGFTVNGGMNWIQATPNAISFVQRFLESCDTMCDDQIVLNELIAGNKSNNGYEILWGPRNNTNSGGNTSYPQRFFYQSRVGRSEITGHTVKILDSDLAFRGNNPSEDPDFICPPREINWVSMPAVDPKHYQRRVTRDNIHHFKLRLYEYWEQKCGNHSHQ